MDPLCIVETEALQCQHGSWTITKDENRTFKATVYNALTSLASASLASDFAERTSSHFSTYFWVISCLRTTVLWDTMTLTADSNTTSQAALYIDYTNSLAPLLLNLIVPWLYCIWSDKYNYTSSSLLHVILWLYYLHCPLGIQLITWGHHNRPHTPSMAASNEALLPQNTHQ